MPLPEETAALNAQWTAIQDHVRQPHPEAFRSGVRWVLVHVFGDDRQYQYDAEFHAQVHATEQMLLRLVELRERSTTRPV